MLVQVEESPAMDPPPAAPVHLVSTLMVVHAKLALWEGTHRSPIWSLASSVSWVAFRIKRLRQAVCPAFLAS